MVITMKKFMKFTAMAVTAALVCSLAACGAGKRTRRPGREAETMRIRLGSSLYAVTLSSDFEPRTIADEGIAESQVACYYREETELNIDIHQIGKNGEAELLSDFVTQQAEEHGASEVSGAMDINGIEVGYFRAAAKYDGTERDTLSYIIDNDGTEYIEIVFRLDGDAALDDAEGIMNTLERLNTKTVALGETGLYLELPEDYVDGELPADDKDDDRILYMYSESSSMDFDVYYFSKDSDEELLADYIAGEAEEDGADQFATDIELNGLECGYYYSDEKSDGEVYTVLNYLFDTEDGNYLKLRFRLDGISAEAEAYAILDTLTR